ncbi:hypothetical protein ACFL1Y_00615 [Patescibacteria group bacterium]
MKQSRIKKVCFVFIIIFLFSNQVLLIAESGDSLATDLNISNHRYRLIKDKRWLFSGQEENCPEYMYLPPLSFLDRTGMFLEKNADKICFCVAEASVMFAFYEWNKIQIGLVNKIKVKNDLKNNKSLGLDKISHGFVAKNITQVSIRFANQIFHDKKSSIIFGGATGLISTSLAEVIDGFKSQSGSAFSWSDEYAHFIGVTLGCLYEIYPDLSNYVEFKFSINFLNIFSNSTTQEEAINFNPNYDDFIFWLVIKGKKVLPQKISFVDFAFGTSTTNYRVHNQPTQRNYHFSVSVDINHFLRIEKNSLKALLFDIFYVPIFMM